MFDLDRRVLGLLERLHEAPGDASRVAPVPGCAAGRDLARRGGAVRRPGPRGPAGDRRRLGPRPDVGPAAATSCPRCPTRARPRLPLGGVHELSGRQRRSSAHRRCSGRRSSPRASARGPGLVVVTERGERHVKSVALVLPRCRTWKPSVDRSGAARAPRAAHGASRGACTARLAERDRDSGGARARRSIISCSAWSSSTNGCGSRTRTRAPPSCSASTPGFASRASARYRGARTSARARCERLLRSERARAPRSCYAHPEDGRAAPGAGDAFRLEERPADRRRPLLARALHRRSEAAAPEIRSACCTRCYGMTRGETRLAMLLLGGCSVEEAAQLLGISVGTARGVLKKVFDKTGDESAGEPGAPAAHRLRAGAPEDVAEPPPAPKHRRAPRRRASA